MELCWLQKTPVKARTSKVFLYVKRSTEDARPKKDDGKVKMNGWAENRKRVVNELRSRKDEWESLMDIFGISQEKRDEYRNWLVNKLPNEIDRVTQYCIDDGHAVAAHRLV